MEKKKKEEPKYGKISDAEQLIADFPQVILLVLQVMLKLMKLFQKFLNIKMHL